MLKNISNLGKTLKKAEQKAITGGKLLAPVCSTDEDCGSTECHWGVRSICSNQGQCHLVACN